MQTIKANEKDASAAADQVQQLIQTTSEAVQKSFDSWAAAVKKQSASWFIDVQAAIEDSCRKAEAAMQVSINTYKALVEEANAHFQREEELVSETNALVQDAVESEVRRDFAT